MDNCSLNLVGKLSGYMVCEKKAVYSLSLLGFNIFYYLAESTSGKGEANPVF